MKERASKPKSQYQPPKLVSYGDLTEMTHTTHNVIHSSDGTKGNNKS